MIINNSTAISCMKEDIEYFYYDLIDLKCMPKQITIFSNTLEDFKKHDFVRVTDYEDEILIDIQTESITLISEAISFAKTKDCSIVYLSFETEMDISGLKSICPMELDHDQKHKHWGIYGAIHNPEEIVTNPGIKICAPTPDDINFISSLPNKEWAFLPQRIKFLKNLLLAKQGDKLLGYLVYDSVEKGHYDILMLYTHPESRRMGVASALVKTFAIECFHKNGISYYVCANSEPSAKLAQSLNIKEIRKELTIYKLK